MPSAAQLDPRSVPTANAELATAEILDSAMAPDQPVRCVIPSDDPLLHTDPLPWEPNVTPDGFFYPKKGDSALIGMPPDGPPWIIRWAQAASAVPDSLL
jgi:hypothetical protein